MFNIEQASAVREGTELISALTFTAQHHTPCAISASWNVKKKKKIHV